MSLTRDVIAVETEALGTVYVPRFSQFMITAIVKKAQELYPSPDPKPFEMLLPDAALEGDMVPASQNPEYVNLIAAVMLKRNRYLQYAALSAVEIRDDDGKGKNPISHDEIVSLYRHVLESMRQPANIPDDENVFALTLHYCVLKPVEYTEIINAATKEQALSQEEVLEGLRIFRRNLSRNGTNGHRSEQSASDIQEAGEVQAQ